MEHHLKEKEIIPSKSMPDGEVDSEHVPAKDVSPWFVFVVWFLLWDQERIYPVNDTICSIAMEMGSLFNTWEM